LSEFSLFEHLNTKGEFPLALAFTVNKIERICLLLDADLWQALVNMVMHFLLLLLLLLLILQYFDWLAAFHLELSQAILFITL